MALWPLLERQAAGLPAFRGYDLRGNPEFPAITAWLKAMAARPAVARASSDDGTLVRLFSKVFGMKGAQMPTDAAPSFGSSAAREAAAKLVLNHDEVVSDILLHAQLGVGSGTAGLSFEAVVEAVELSVALVASRLAAAPPPEVAKLVEAPEIRSAYGVIVCAALSFLRVRVSAPRDMSAAAADQLRTACQMEASEAFDKFGYV